MWIFQSMILGLALQAAPAQATPPPPPAAKTAPMVKTPRRMAKAVERRATAKCKDDSYSFAKRHADACVHHGGVAEWMK